MNAEPIPMIIRRPHLVTFLPEEGVYVVEPLRFVSLNRMATAGPAKKSGL